MRIRRSSFSLQCGSGSCFSSRWCEPGGVALQPLQASTPQFWASTAQFWASTALHGSIFEPQKLLNFDFNADPNPDPAFHSNADQDSASKNNADPDPKPSYLRNLSTKFYSVRAWLGYPRSTRTNPMTGPTSSSTLLPVILPPMAADRSER